VQEVFLQFVREMMLLGLEPNPYSICIHKYTNVQRKFIDQVACIFYTFGLINRIGKTGVAMKLQCQMSFRSMNVYTGRQVRLSYKVL
jgi:hypothetical protein